MRLFVIKPFQTIKLLSASKIVPENMRHLVIILPTDWAALLVHFVSWQKWLAALYLLKSLSFVSACFYHIKECHPKLSIFRTISKFIRKLIKLHLQCKFATQLHPFIHFAFLLISIIIHRTFETWHFFEIPQNPIQGRHDKLKEFTIQFICWMPYVFITKESVSRNETG